MTAAEFIAQMETITALAEQGLGIAAKLDPAADIPLAAIGAIVPVVEALAEAAINGWSEATGTPITVESITALLPNPIPLTPPSA
jgi:hypothetical protein